MGTLRSMWTTQINRNMSWLACCTILTLCSFTALAAGTTTIEGVRVAQEDHEIRLVFEANDVVHYKSFTLTKPERLVVDISNATMKKPLQPVLPSQQTTIKSIRVGQQAQQSIRVVLDLNHPIETNIFTLAPSDQYKHRLVVDITDPKSPPNVTTATVLENEPKDPPVVTAEPVASPRAEPEKTKQKSAETETSPPHIYKAAELAKTRTVENIKSKPSKTPLAKLNSHTEASVQQITDALIPKLTINQKNKKLRDVVVVIDAGHGGHDPGAHGPNDTQEKDVVLEIAKELAAQISRQDGMKAVLTRDEDFFIPLRERLRLARKGKADMFIAIHADAYKSPSSSGASVFALSQKGASSEAARWLAEKENISELGGATISDKSSLLFSVLLDLSQTGTIRESLNLGNDILNELRKITKLHHPSVEQAPFMVLKSPDIPSLLIETGFISNPEEEEKLTDSEHQRQLAQAILVGIRQYFILNPPPDSHFAARQQNNRTHIVQYGETLNSIAKQYHISISALEKINRIDNDDLEHGRVLYIPDKYA